MSHTIGCFVVVLNRAVMELHVISWDSIPSSQADTTAADTQISHFGVYVSSHRCPSAIDQ
jgi:hypothetical protein